MAAGCPKFGVALVLAFCAIGDLARSELGAIRSPEEGDPCDPTAERVHSIHSDKTAFLICDLEKRTYHLHHCDSNDGVLRIFNANRMQCIPANEEHHWLLMAPPGNGPWKKVGESCIVNRECADGMHCAGAICTCYMNFVQVNSMCVRISSTCPDSTYYPEPINGKPKICSPLEPCPPGYVCRPEQGGEQGYCCLATAAEVCGLSSPHIINGRPVSCYDTSASSESCPESYSCELYPLANRRYCCDKRGASPSNPSEVNKTMIGQVSAKPKPDLAYCPPFTTPFLHDGNPLICNPANGSSCPPGNSCQKSDKFALHFCCNAGLTELSSAQPTSTTSGPFVMPEKPWVSTAAGPTNAKPDVSYRGAPGLLPPEICSPVNRAFTFEGKPVMCIANDSASCPVGYACTMHTPTVYFCCRVSSGLAESGVPLANIQPTISTVTIDGAKVFVEMPETVVSTTPSFRPPPIPVPSIESICGPSSKPYLYGDNPVMCLVNETGNCPMGYVCDLHHPSDAYFCCQRETPNSPKGLTAPLNPNPSGPSGPQIPPRQAVNSEGCPDQRQAAMDPNGGVQMCDLLLSPDSCPTDHVCLYSVIFGRYQCCGKVATVEPSVPAVPASPLEKSALSKLSRKYSSGPTNECPPGQVAYRDPVGNETHTCAANQLDGCPGGYFCQWSESSGKFLCCGISAGCPARGVAHVDPNNGEVQRCSHPSDTSCPPGYMCQRTVNASLVCCSGGSGFSSQPRLHPASFENTRGNLSPEKPTLAPPVIPVTTSPTVQPGQVCAVGLPLTESGTAGRYKTCSEGTKCPTGYQCTPSSIGPVCCLKPEKVCSLSEDAGTSGCSNSTGQGTRYVYDQASESCKAFSYNGCAGNLNNFASLIDCELFCAAGMCPRGLPVRVNNKAQQCTPENTQCPTDYECTPSVYASTSPKSICCPTPSLICNLIPLAGQPCQSNGSNVQSLIRFHYNPTLRTCRTFSYYGCGGNANNFESFDECRSDCANVQFGQPLAPDMPISTSESPLPELTTVPVPVLTTPLTTELRCPVVGQVLHSDPAFRTCLPSAVFPCPDGFTCQKGLRINNGEPTDNFVCCGPPTGPEKNQICPNGTEVFLNPLAKQPTVCNPADADACPKGFGCVLSKFMRTFYCCSTTQAHRSILVEPPPQSTGHLFNTMEELEPECPAGKKPFLYPRTTRPLACPHANSKCPPNHSCTISTNSNTYLCCSDKRDDSETPSHGISSRNLLPPNPLFLQRGVALPPFTASLNARAPFFPSKVPLGIGQWIPTADEAADPWPHRSATYESEPLLPYGQVHVLETREIGAQPTPVSLPLEIFLPNRAADESVRSISCNVSEKKQLGEECCAHEQCLYHCGNFKGQRFCVCPRHRILDLTHETPKCSTTCTKYRMKGLCLPENPERPYSPPSTMTTEMPPVKRTVRRRAPVRRSRPVSRTFARRRVATA